MPIHVVARRLARLNAYRSVLVAATTRARSGRKPEPVTTPANAEAGQPDGERSGAMAQLLATLNGVETGPPFGQTTNAPPSPKFSELAIDGARRKLLEVAAKKHGKRSPEYQAFEEQLSTATGERFVEAWLTNQAEWPYIRDLLSPEPSGPAERRKAEIERLHRDGKKAADIAAELNRRFNKLKPLTEGSVRVIVHRMNKPDGREQKD